MADLGCVIAPIDAECRGRESGRVEEMNFERRVEDAMGASQNGIRLSCFVA